jgi:hypothetical protein
LRVTTVAVLVRFRYRADMSQKGDHEGFHVVLHEPSGGICVAREISGSGGWWLGAVFVPYRGQIALAELKVYPGPAPGANDLDWSQTPEALVELPEGGITARLLRRVRVGEVIERAHQLVKSGEGLSSRTDLDSLVPKQLQELVRRAPARPGRAGREDYYYAVWAARYVSKVATGSKHPNIDVAKEFEVTPEKVRDHVYESRRRELLTKTIWGRPGGELTGKARAILLQEITMTSVESGEAFGLIEVTTTPTESDREDTVK